MKTRGIIVCAVTVAAVVAALWPTEHRGAGAASDEEITVLAAASLADALVRVGAEYERVHGVRVRFDFAATGVLRRKVEAGAAADVFLSASVRHMDVLESGGHVAPGTRRRVLRNALVCVVPAGSSLEMSRPRDLSTGGVRRIAMGDPGYVPAGEYAEEALARLGLRSALEERLVPCANVRAALAQAEMGAADAAIVYGSDALVTKKVRTAFRFPAGSHSSIVYPCAVLRAGSRPERAAAFVAFLASARCTEVFEEYGFEPVGGAWLAARGGEVR